MNEQDNGDSKLGGGALALGVLQQMGPRWVARRVFHAARLRGGLLARRDPVGAWEMRDDDAGFSSVAPQVLGGMAAWEQMRAAFGDWDARAAAPPQKEAEELLAGRFLLFGWRTVTLGTSPAWNRDALSGQEWPTDRHWSEIGDFDASDIKVVWEPSRWGWALALARAWARTGDKRLPAKFGELVEDWMRGNPPGAGPNWKCGQEAALRLIAGGIAGAIFCAEGGGANPETLRRLAALAEQTGRRIEANLEYALGQNNNHGLSELAGLITAAVLFPRLEGSQGRLERACAGFVREVERLVDADGSFSQYSTNYHRVLLHNALWVGRLLAIAGQPLPATTLARLDAAALWLWNVFTPADGSAPCYGANDGANFLKLDGGAYADYRATVQAAFVLTRGSPVLPAGPWDETAAWLFGPEVLRRARQVPEHGCFQAPTGGYYVLRRSGTTAFVRCGAHRFRPHHADQLHVDLRREEGPLTLDPGTYSYHAPPPLDHAFKRTRFHNTVSVDSRDQMRSAGRFLWLRWSTGRSPGIRSAGGGRLAVWEGETDAWQRLVFPVEHRRAVVVARCGSVVVVDRLRSKGDHDYRLHWHLPAEASPEPAGWSASYTGRAGGTFEMRLATPAGAGRPDWVRSDAQRGRGWASPRYLELVPAWSCEIPLRGSNVWFVTQWARAGEPVELFGDRLSWAGGALELSGEGSILRRPGRRK